MKAEDFKKYYTDFESVEIDIELVEILKPFTRAKYDSYSTNIENIPKDKAIDDVEIFFDILKYCYSGYEYYSDKVDFAEIKQSIITSLPQNSTTFIIRDLLFNALEPHINDSHFSFVADHWLSFRKLYTAYFTSLIVGLKDGAYVVLRESSIVKKEHMFTYAQVKDYLFETLPGKNGVRRFLLGIYTQNLVKRITVGDFNLPVHRCKTDLCEAGTDEAGEYMGIPFVHHATYGNEQVKLSYDGYKALGAKYKNSPVLIWSVLSNGGGNSNYPENFVRGLNGSAVWKLDLATINNPLINDGAENKMRYDIYNSGEIDYSKSEYAGKLFVLQNKNVGSSGEAALMYARNVKDVCFVGSASMGCGQFGDTLTYKLPNSQLVLSWVIKYSTWRVSKKERDYTPIIG